VFEDKSLYFTNDVGLDATRTGQGDWLQPKLTFALGRPDMNMRRLIPFIGVEVKSK
jgi:hypothetical protein